MAKAMDLEESMRVIREFKEFWLSTAVLPNGHIGEPTHGEAA